MQLIDEQVDNFYDKNADRLLKIHRFREALQLLQVLLKLPKMIQFLKARITQMSRDRGSLQLNFEIIFRKRFETPLRCPSLLQSFHKKAGAVPPRIA